MSMFEGVAVTVITCCRYKRGLIAKALTHSQMYNAAYLVEMTCECIIHIILLSRTFWITHLQA